jgi:hypothetical protein
LSDRFDPGLATRLLGNPPVIPDWISLIVFGLFYLYLYTRPVRESKRSMVAFLGMTWCVFLLWAKGWSPQWMQMLIPLVLLVFPTRQSILAILLFMIINFVEWPLLVSRGQTFGILIAAPVRTALIIGFLTAFIRVYVAPLSDRWRIDRLHFYPQQVDVQ